jgi:flagellar motility protein MotE (MotC chaperone)
MNRIRAVLRAAIVVATSGTIASAAEEAKAPATIASLSAVKPVESAGAPADNATLYCRNIVNAAADARYARQVDALAAMDKQLSDRIDALEKKRAEYETWVKRREELLRKADESVVAIYSQMRPDAAAKQIAVMEEESAAAILSKLSPRIASSILNEMDARTAARLTNVIAGLSTAAKQVAKS